MRRRRRITYWFAFESAIGLEEVLNAYNLSRDLIIYNIDDRSEALARHALLVLGCRKPAETGRALEQDRCTHLITSAEVP